MTKTILPNSFGSSLLLAVEVAWGADRSNGNTTWTWTDITADVVCSGSAGVSFTQGAADEQPVASSATCSFTLLNTGNKYTNAPASANWPNVVRGTPVRVRLILSSTSHTMYQGYLAAIVPGYDTSGKTATATWSCSGLLKQITQNSTPVRSALAQGIPAVAGVVGYWPMEDGTLATQFAPAVGTANAYLGSAAVLSQGALSPASNKLPQFQGGGAYADLPGFVDTSKASVAALFDFPANAVLADGTVLLRMWLTSSLRIDATVRGTATLPHVFIKFELYLNGALLDSDGTYDFPAFAGTAQLININATYTAPNLTWGWWICDKNGVSFSASKTPGDYTVGRVRRAELLPNGTSVAMNAGHLFARSTYDSSPGTNVQWPAEAYNAFYENSRISSTLTTNGWPAPTIWGPFEDCRLGRQPVATPTALLTEAATTDGGQLSDGFGPSLNYVNRAGFENKGYMSIDVTAGGVGTPAPVDDDQKLRNQVTVTQSGGSSYTYAKTAGADSTAVAGVQPASEQVNVYSEGAFAISGSFGLKALQDRAGWLVNLGTAGGYRFPKLRLLFHAKTSLLTDWFGNSANQVGAVRMVLTKADQVNASLPALIDVLGVGWTFTIGQHQLVADINCTPADPWRVILLGSASGDTREYLGRLDTGGSSVHTSVAIGATSISVDTTTGPLWTIDSDDFPLIVSIGGIPVTVTNITGSSSPQTFTVTGSTVTKALTSGYAVSVYRAPRIAIGGSP